MSNSTGGDKLLAEFDEWTSTNAPKQTDLRTLQKALTKARKKSKLSKMKRRNRKPRKSSPSCRHDEYDCSPDHILAHFRSRSSGGWPIAVCPACLPKILQYLDDRFFVTVQCCRFPLTFERYFINMRTYRDTHAGWLTPEELGIRAWLRLNAL